MVSSKTCICVLMTCSLALGFRIDSREKRQIPEGPWSSITDGFTNGIQDSGVEQVKDQITTGIQEPLGSISGLSSGGDIVPSVVGGITNRTENAFKNTIDEQTSSIKDGIEAINDKIQQKVQTAAGLFKTAIDLALTVPKFIRNFKE
ncbi:uncharacterized protein LOC106647018 [Copidosoma floridanum]|uniref:uncharacterized protein LOC106647018 n=1 Tax=Copidosoma floridanum TaxID=29053 RepID=UPI0006C94441|nr:uncharacterized protein LOC106647018 [Copidosoma floridanum]